MFLKAKSFQFLLKTETFLWNANLHFLLQCGFSLSWMTLQADTRICCSVEKWKLPTVWFLVEGHKIEEQSKVPCPSVSSSLLSSYHGTVCHGSRILFPILFTSFNFILLHNSCQTEPAFFPFYKTCIDSNKHTCILLDFCL